METLGQLLDRFETLLEEENRLLVESIKDKGAAQRILELVAQKEKIFKRIADHSRSELLPYKERLELIDELTQRNKALAINNIEFINEIFDAVYSVSAPTQYTKDGSLTTKREGFLNKKV
ncbi:MAG: hypothetical protein GXO19_06765 [Epsilonproteobacteria bacterium]|nr:hypothetical protein [Campylobacterota bacterium]NPA57417.1 hypothetical protein [Campylobacterota bacterium]